MDNQQYKELLDHNRRVLENPMVKKLRDHKSIILTHLQQPAHKLIDEYLSSIKIQIMNQMIYSPINSKGKDISDILRGKIEVIDQMLGMKDTFDGFDKLEQTVKGAN